MISNLAFLGALARGLPVYQPTGTISWAGCEKVWCIVQKVVRGQRAGD
jgi:hypothetical protein